MRVRTWQLLSRLAGWYDVLLVTWAEEPGALVDAARGWGWPVEVIALPTRPVSRSPLARGLRQARFLGGGDPPYARQLLEERSLDSAPGRAAFRMEVIGWLAGRVPDLLVVEEEALSVAVTSSLRGLARRTVLHRHNLFAPLLGELRRATLQGRVAWTVERRGWRRFDAATLEGIDLVVALTRESADVLRAIRPGLPVAVVPTGVELGTLGGPLLPSAGADVAFLGWMGYPANVDAVTWFAAGPWPRIRARFPDAILRIVGRDPAPEVRRLAGPGVVVTGEVADPVEACKNVRVGVVPLRAGMGMKTKTLEFMGMGLPVVSTVVGAEGIDAGRDDGLIVVDGVPDFAAGVAGLLDDAPAADRLGAASRRFVERAHSWDAISAAYRGHLDELLAGARDRA